MAPGLWTRACILAAAVFRFGDCHSVGSHPSQAPLPNTIPIAPHLFFSVKKGQEVEIPLPGYDLEGDRLVTRITSLPVSGSLYQLSQVYSDYGYAPKRGSLINSPGTTVSGSKQRIMYKRPDQDISTEGKWASFKYTVSDLSSTSYEGIVTLVAEDLVTVASGFSSSDDGWRIMGNGKGVASLVPPVFDPTTRGLMNRFIHSTDALIDTASATNQDQAQWYFSAPQKFLGNQGVNYGGTLEFDLASFSGDFSDGIRLVRRLRDATSAARAAAAIRKLQTNYAARGRLNDAGLADMYQAPYLTFNGRATHFSLDLMESAGWLKDPKNTLVDWAPASVCDLVEVLSGLSSLRILGDFTRWYESVSLDNVRFVAPQSGAAKTPMCAQIRPDGSNCRCDGATSAQGKQ